MKKWEYRSTWEYGSMTNKEMNELGQEGWELVGCQMDQQCVNTFYVFKREVVEQKPDVITLSDLYHDYKIGNVEMTARLGSTIRYAVEVQHLGDTPLIDFDVREYRNCGIQTQRQLDDIKKEYLEKLDTHYAS